MAGISPFLSGGQPPELLDALGRLVELVCHRNPFYKEKFARAGIDCPPDTLAEFSKFFPFTTKAEIVSDQLAHPPYGTNLTYPLERYIRCHQTSGTSGAPLRWLDTPETWESMVQDWVKVFHAAEVGRGDRILFAFSFGPFLGFWLAFEAGQKVNALCFAGGGMSSAVRARVLLENSCNVLCCTPTYALHLAEVVREESLDIRRHKLRRIIVAGEPGGSQPAIRARLEEAWPGARVFDHHGMTETGPVTFESTASPGQLQLIEGSFIAEFIHPDTQLPVGESEPAELVLTTLRRTGSPLIRYRTGDLVRLRRITNSGSSTLVLDGGILGRLDDMVIIRGVNIYPSAIEALVRTLPEIGEFRATVDRRNNLTELDLEVEASSSAAKELERRLHQALGLRISVRTVPASSLPRFELKAKRWRRLERPASPI